ncbi:Golgi apparatus membrane protein-like protein [Hapsidospora chrysogenum ATCC 11550]|uniref:Golgi apparatus membrane protein-like protein n=1 Tax=Hapsidospora chrysogenum (strain ATCC 11550 / CBS 779.69 / DSM 880 / IAM 14645 / JCM 23072 / IMI 49137) TaxID=857340 RepID=A0A086T992_HAPC1|nr:Golgi apparatus membrane protein-like protein [Hapsidospora chrysogenum ATCC 11550]
MTLKEEFQTRNFSIYGQWLGILSMIICFAVGIANIFAFLTHPLIIVFCALALVSAFLILFIEVPLLLRICPTSSTFDAAIRRISTNYLRAAAYAVMAVLQFLSTLDANTSLIAAGVFLALTAICYLLAAIKGQAFVGSKTLGGQGVAQMIV